MSPKTIKLIGSMYVALGRMSASLENMERLLTSSKPQPPRPNTRPVAPLNATPKGH